MKQIAITVLSAAALSLTLTPANAQFNVRLIDAPGTTQILDIDSGEALLASEPTFATDAPAVINYFDGVGDGDFGGGTLFPLLGNTEDYALDATGVLTFNTAGTYVFQVNSDDGFRLRLDNVVVSEFTGPRGPGDTDTAGIVHGVGDTSSLRLTYFERGGGDEVELSYSLDGGPQTLVGSSTDITVAPVPEPATIGLLGLSAVGLMALRRRR